MFCREVESGVRQILKTRVNDFEGFDMSFIFSETIEKINFV